MLRAALASKVVAAVDRLIASCDLPETVRSLPVEILDTKDPAHGDFACNLALAASKAAGMNPRQIAEKLQSALASEPDFEAVEVAGPGFLNIRLKPEAIASYVEVVLRLGPDLVRRNAQLPEPPESHPPVRGGSATLSVAEGEPGWAPSDTKHPTPLRINVEFVSVNPNGPITVGSGRGAAYGDTLCRVLEAAGHTVNREYYINDGVNSEQMRLFAESVKHYCLDALGETAMFPQAGYKGEYVKRVADQLPWSSEDNIVARLERLADEVSDANREVSEILSFINDNPSDPVGTRRLEAAAERYEWARREMDLIYMIEERATHARSAASALHEVYGGIVAMLPLSVYQDFAQRLMLEQQKHDLFLFGVEFDIWFSEQSLHDSGEVEKRIEELTAKGAADDEPHRVKLKTGKGGTIEDVLIEEQPEPAEDDVHGETPTPNPSPSTGVQGEGKTLWLRSSKFGDDMDRVLRRKDGRLTYIASDVAYHKDKFNRPPNADKLITVLGPDHHGYIGRLHAVLAALELQSGTPVAGVSIAGVPPVPSEALSELEAKIYRSPEERDACKAAVEKARKELDVVIFQIVRFVKDGKPAPMRKRDGNIYELRDLIKELGQAQAPNSPEEEQLRIGKDVARFFYLMRSHDTHMDFDIDLATKQSDENPVFYVQYAHARICSVIRKAKEAGLEQGSAKLLVHAREMALIKKILDLPEEVQRCSEDYAVHRIATYAVELARTYHHFYDQCRVIQPDQPELSQARVALCEAAKIALEGALRLLGVSAPERMDRVEA